MLVERSRAALLAAVLLLVGAGCAPRDASPAAPPMDAPAAPADDAFVVIAEGPMAPTGPTETVYRDAEAWQRAGIPAEASPDFAREVVLLAAVEAPTGGHRVRFERVERADDGLVARYVVEEPGAGCMVTQAFTTPFQAVVVRGAPDARVRFVQRRERYACG